MMQSYQSGDDKTKSALQESRNRIKTMTLIHERLYQSSDLSHINFSEYVHTLALQIYTTHKVSSSRVALRINVPDLEIDIDTVIPCGLILNELISNALKYAFPDDREGEVVVSFEMGDDGLWELVVKDNGVGLPEDFNPESSRSLGMSIIASLAKQLGGEIKIFRRQGCEFRITTQNQSLATVQWHEKYHSVQIAEIDQQHKEFFEIVNSLKKAIETGEHLRALEVILPKLVDHTKKHFALEEKYMTEGEYPHYDSHKASHDDFMISLGQVIDTLKEGKEDPSLDLYRFLVNWIVRHIGEADMKLGDFLRRKGTL